MSMKELPVDAGMIGIMPLAAVNHADAWLEGGQVVNVAGGCWLSLCYDNGRITIQLDSHGAIPVDEDSKWWIGDPCYLLENNIPSGEAGDWTKAADPAPGYWSACVASLRTPRAGRFAAQPYQLDGGLQGLVASTMWGDGCYPLLLQTRYDNYLKYAVIETGDVEDEDYDEDEE